MRRIPLVPLREDEIDLVLLVYRVEQLEKQLEWLARQPREQLERKEAQAVIGNTTIQWMILGIVAINALTQLAVLFHL